MKKERRTFSEWFKDIAGIEGNLKDTLKPAVGYTSGNIMLGGAGYPISMYHQQYLTYVEGLSTKQAGFISLIGGMWDAITDPIIGNYTDRGGVNKQKIMKIITNISGTRSIEVTDGHLKTIKKYKLFCNLIDSNGIIDESVMEKLRLNVRALLETEGTENKELMDLCFDVIYHPNMKAIGLSNLVKYYAEHLFSDEPENEGETDCEAQA